MSELKACIFDLDGVIVDTATYHYKAWKRLANELGFDLTEEQNEQLKGVSRMKSLDILLDIGNMELSEKEKADQAEKKNQWYRSYIKEMKPDDIFPGTLPLMEQLKTAGIKIAIGSASKNARTIIDQIRIEPYLDSIVDGNKITKAKPDPEIFRLAAQELQEDPKDCVVFEDAQSGVQAANNAGMVSIGIGVPDVLNEANHVIAGLHEINLNKLKKLFTEHTK